LAPLLGLLALAGACHAQEYDVVHRFYQSAGDGSFPRGFLVQSGSTLYGTTLKGGAGTTSPYSGFGTLFGFNLDTQAVSVLHTFNGSDGAFPAGSLLPSGSLFYGTTSGFDGITATQYYDDGNLFAFNPTTQGLTVLHTFGGGPTDGSRPNGSLVRVGNTLYGMTVAGGANNAGILYTYDFGSRTYSVVHHFSGGSDDGAAPWGSLIQSGDLLYGMTRSGGTSNRGTLFAFDITSNTVDILHSFAGGPADGATPLGSLLKSGNLLYGTTAQGGDSNAGTIFAYDPLTSAETVLHDFAFTADNGAAPVGSLIEIQGQLYGTTASGGLFGLGTVFAFEPASRDFSLLHTFAAFLAKDGSSPIANLLHLGDALYGTARGDIDEINSGVIFSITVPESMSLSILGVGISALILRRRSNPKGTDPMRDDKGIRRFPDALPHSRASTFRRLLR
jgi:uncharacterized repeat protein (TIGR03803 family)